MPSGTPHLDDVRLATAIAAALLVGAVVRHASRPDVDAAPSALARHVVDVNAAPAGEIEALPGVGRVLADRIVAERASGPFADVDDLRRVPGVGRTTLARLRGFVRCGR
jgi:competence ComEA-like helix-hairpin-helix protein